MVVNCYTNFYVAVNFSKSRVLKTFSPHTSPVQNKLDFLRFNFISSEQMVT